VLYYRKDILSSLDMAIPETWTEVYNNVLPVLYQNSLEMYVPENYATYSALLYQNGGAFYTPDGLTVALDNAAGYQAFKTMVEMYTKYAIPYTANFYNKFRTGEIPIGVAGFGDYTAFYRAYVKRFGHAPSHDRSPTRTTSFRLDEVLKEQQVITPDVFKVKLEEYD